MFDGFSGEMEAHRREWWDSTMETPEETAPHLVSFITILQRVGSLGNAHGSDAHDAPNLCQTHAHSQMDKSVTRHQLPCHFNAGEISLAVVSPDPVSPDVK